MAKSANWRSQRPHLRLIATPVSASDSHHQAWQPPRDFLKLLWLNLADVA
jgi:hypothetical protein